jgi:hypothetical protein
MTDTSAQHKRLAKRMDTGLSRSINDNPMLRWQVPVMDSQRNLRPLITGQPSGVAFRYSIFQSCQSRSPYPYPLSLPFFIFLVPNGILIFFLLCCVIEATLDDFLAWYGGMDERVDALSMQEIWDGCSPLDAKDQKPLFKAEQEAEKALGYLEGLSLTQLAAALLSSGLFHSLPLILLAFLMISPQP